MKIPERPFMDIDQVTDVSDIIKRNEGRLENNEFRREFERRDFIHLNRVQMEIVNSPARFTFAQCGNQVGKTTGAMYKASYFLTGTPIPNYTGRPWPNPTIDRSYKRVMWIMGGQTGQTAILGAQTRLFGDVISGKIGTGMLPLRAIKKLTYQHGVPGLISDAVIQRDDGELAVCRIRTYSQGKEALTSEAVDFIVMDELPPDLALQTELIARTATTDGSILLTATPGRQLSDVIQWWKT
jgi:phage terminase large subunit-like protein